MKNSLLADFALLKNKKIGLITGGISSERAIALRSSAGAERALQNLGLNYIRLDFNRANRKDIFSIIRKAKIDVAFLGLHGAYGEDGRIQGALDIMGIKYTGSNALGSAVAMDKLVTKKILLNAKLPTPKFMEYRSGKVCFTLPAVVKPVDGGSTIGVTIVKKAKAMNKAIALARKYCCSVMLEEYIKGREVTVPVFFGKALSIIEIIPKTAFYDFKAKYTAGMSVHVMPAKLDRKLYVKVQELAVKTHKALGLGDYSRIDFMISKKGAPYIIEANTLPGLTNTSLLPEAVKYEGLSFEQMVLKMLAGALRHE